MFLKQIQCLLVLFFIEGNDCLAQMLHNKLIGLLAELLFLHLRNLDTIADHSPNLPLIQTSVSLSQHYRIQSYQPLPIFVLGKNLLFYCLADYYIHGLNDLACQVILPLQQAICYLQQ